MLFIQLLVEQETEQLLRQKNTAFKVKMYALMEEMKTILEGGTSVMDISEMLENVEKYTKELPEFAYRQRAKAGLTGMAQIYGKYNTSPKDKLVLDLTYINQYSVWLDIKLIFRTLLVLLTPDQSTEAFEENSEDKKTK